MQAAGQRQQASGLLRLHSGQSANERTCQGLDCLAAQVDLPQRVALGVGHIQAVALQGGGRREEGKPVSRDER